MEIGEVYRITGAIFKGHYVKVMEQNRSVFFLKFVKCVVVNTIEDFNTHKLLFYVKPDSVVIEVNPSNIEYFKSTTEFVE